MADNRLDSKTVGVTIRFFTNDLAEEPGEVVPGLAWTAGVVMVQANHPHGIKAGRPVPFHRMAELPLAVEQALEAAAVTLRIGKPASKLFTTDELYAVKVPGHYRFAGATPCGRRC